MTPEPADRYATLPSPVRLEDTIAEVDARPVPDPDGGTNPETAFVLRYAG